MNTRSMQIRSGSAAALVTAALTASSAQALLITFEQQSPGETLNNQYADWGISFTPNAFAGVGSSTSGASWATNTDMTIVSSFGSDVGGLGSPSLVNGNILRSFDSWGSEDGDPSFAIDFAVPLSSFSADFCGVSTGPDVRIFAYNGATLLATVAGPASTTGQFTLSYSATTITKVIVAPGGYFDWVGVDNIEFIPVPAPQTLAVLGLGALLTARRRR